MSFRALLVLRADASTRYGGDTRLAYETLAALRKAGVEADLVESATPDARGYDVAHVINVGVPAIAESQVDACEGAGVPVVISPVWLDLREMEGRGRAFERALIRERDPARAEGTLRRLRLTEKDRLLGRRGRTDLKKRERAQADVLRRARALLPNSAIEARDCMVRLGVHGIPLCVLPIATNLEPAAAWREERHGVVIVGRVETRKNQLTTLFGLRDDDIDIDVIGAEFDLPVAAACRRWCPRARLHGPLPRHEVLASLGRARVHVLASWCETAGIASLEAALAGAQLVVGDRGAEFEYFGEDAEYADPANPESIRAAVHRALARPARRRGDSLDLRVRRHAWESIARDTLRTYTLALRNG